MCPADCQHLQTVAESWLTVRQHFGPKRNKNCRLTDCYLLTNSWPFIDLQLTDSWQTIGQQSGDRRLSWQLFFTVSFY